MISIPSLRDFVALAHQGQKYGNSPYTYHLYNVLHIGITHYPYEEMGDFLKAALLCHDILEDTICSVDLLESVTNHVTVDIVKMVTNDKTLSRKEAHKKQYPIIAQSRHAYFVKLCDRLSNVEAGDKNDMYRKEHRFFKETLQSGPWGMQYPELWNKIDDLLF